MQISTKGKESTKMKNFFTLVLICCSLVSAQVPTLSVDPILANEGDSVKACVTYQMMPVSETDVVLSTIDNLENGARGGNDFQPIQETLIFSSASPLVQCINITISADSAVENLESFLVEAEINAVHITSSPQTVVIQSSDTVTVGFAQSSYTFSEDTGGQVCVVIEQGSVEINVPFSVAFTNGTASESDSDYDPSFLSGVTIEIEPETPQEGVCFSAAIVSDSAIEGDETYTISIIPNPSITLNPATNSTTVTILNDDASCPAPPNLQYGNVSVNGTAPFMFGAMANYSCDSGFELVGDSVLTCQSGNIWFSTEPGTCARVDCGGLQDIRNGMVTFVSTNFQSQATYSCNNGFFLIGNSTRTCEANGAWSGTEPLCSGATKATVSAGVIFLLFTAYILALL